jgi:hypothetical protein
MKTFKSIFPFDQSVIAEYPLMPDDEIENALALPRMHSMHGAEKALTNAQRFLKSLLNY